MKLETGARNRYGNSRITLGSVKPQNSRGCGRGQYLEDYIWRACCREWELKLGCLSLNAWGWNNTQTSSKPMLCLLQLNSRFTHIGVIRETRNKKIHVSVGIRNSCLHCQIILTFIQKRVYMSQHFSINSSWHAKLINLF